MSHVIRKLTIADLPLFRSLRLAGLQERPDAFGETAQHFALLSDEEIARGFAASTDGGGFRLGAFTDGGRLDGIVCLGREVGEKMSHRGLVWGMYVAQTARGKGLGRQLMVRLVDEARRVEGLQQLHLSVVAANQTAFDLYRSIGFSVYGTDPRVLNVGGRLLDEYLLWYPLSL